MKLLLASVFRYIGPDNSPILLVNASDLNDFNYFTRRTVQEHLRFATRMIVQRTQPGTRQTVEIKDNPFLCHTYVRADNLSCVLVADKEYPPRVAYSFINKILADYEKANQGKWQSMDTDQTSDAEWLTADLAKYQNPQEADKLLKIQRELDEIKDIMHKNIDEVLKRGENLDTLMERSEDLSATSVQFYKRAKKTNSCCRY